MAWVILFLSIGLYLILKYTLRFTLWIIETWINDYEEQRKKPGKYGEIRDRPEWSNE